MKDLQVSYSNLDNNQPIEVSLQGHFTSLSAIEFKNNLFEKMSQKGTDCYVDISKVEKMDITGINALVMAHKMAIRNGNNVFVLNEQNSQAEEFLYLTKLLKYINYSRAGS